MAAFSVKQVLATPAIVLRRVAYGEADLVVTLLAPELGRVSALARAARKSARRFAGGLEPGLGGEARLRERPGAELMSLEGFEAHSARRGIAAELAKAAHAAYAVELCDRLCPSRQPEREVFVWLDEMLDRLDRGRASVERLRVFELGLLRALGLAPSLDRCAQCGRAETGDEEVLWRPESGGVYCQRCGGPAEHMSGGTRTALARLQGATLGEAETLALDRTTAAACRRAVLALIRQHVHGPLRSLEFIEKMRGQGGL